jgi:hypothetical protein
MVSLAAEHSERQPEENAMNRRLITSAVVALAVLSSARLASAQQSGSATEAKAMLDRAVVTLKDNQATAPTQFNDKNDKQFHDAIFTSSATTFPTANSRRTQIRP